MNSLPCKMKLRAFSLIAAGLCLGSAAFSLAAQTEPPPPPPDGDKGAVKERRIDKLGARIGEKVEQKAGMHDGLVRQFLSSLPEEESSKLKKLFSENPEAFKEQMQKRIADFKAKLENDNKLTNDLVKQYREASSAEAKTAVLQKLKENLRKEFNARMEENKRRIDDFEKRVAELQAQYKERQAKVNEIIDERVRELTKDPSLRW